MTTKKAKAKKAKEPNAETVEAINELNDGGGETFETVSELMEDLNSVEAPMSGPDYHVTAAGDIVLTATGAPVPEDHPVHPAHRALAAARKYCK